MEHYLLIDPPSPFAPISELRAFIKEWESRPDRNRPEVKISLENAREDLQEALRHEALKKTSTS